MFTLARAMTALADAHLFVDVAHQIDGTTPTVSVGTMLSGGITPCMHPETATATVEVRVIEGMTPAEVSKAICAVLAKAGLADRVDVVAAPARSTGCRQARRSVIAGCSMPRPRPGGPCSVLSRPRA